MTDPQTKRTGQDSKTTEYSVSELSSAIKRALEDGFGYVRLRGEISGYRGPHASGHCYFALKDDRARIEAVIWRGVFSRLRIKPEEGMEVVATGKVSSYPGSSKYQIVVDSLAPAGLGAMMVQLEERKKRLAKEGLFDDARKQPIPFLPRVVGVVTSPTGAVIRDILAGFKERFPTHVVIWPVKVQGEGSGQEIARAIRGFNELADSGSLKQPDTIIVARGGGSLEDLWSFNDEDVVRAVATSRIPIIAAVGHETDWTLIDLVADARAPTPTKAAEWTVPKYSDLVTDLTQCQSRLRIAVRRFVEAGRSNLKAAARGLPRLEDLIALPRQHFDAIEKRLDQALLANTRAHHTRWVRAGAGLHPAGLRQRVAAAREKLLSGTGRLDTAFFNRVSTHRRVLDGHATLLKSLSYRNVLRRGYAIVRDDKGRMLRQAAAIHGGDTIGIEFGDGRVAATANHGPQPKTPEPATGSRKPASQSRRTRKGGGASGQGSLF